MSSDPQIVPRLYGDCGAHREAARLARALVRADMAEIERAHQTRIDEEGSGAVFAAVSWSRQK